jgi:hypothetical protein
MLQNSRRVFKLNKVWQNRPRPLLIAVMPVSLNHSMRFIDVWNIWKILLIVSSFLSALGDIAGGWLIRYVSADFAYVKIISVLSFRSRLPC